MTTREHGGETRRHASCQQIEPLLAPFGDGAARGVDGVMSAAERQQVTDHLAVCPPCRDKAAACQAARDALRARAANLTSTAPALLTARCRAIALNSEAPPKRHRVRRWLGWSAAAGAAAAVLFIVLMPAQAVATQLALDHVKCTKLGSAAMTGSAHDLEAAWFQKRGQRVSIPEGSAAHGLRLMGVRRCASMEGSVAHVLYQHQGRPLSLFVMKDGARPFDRSLETVGHKAVLWTEDSRTYVLVGREGDLARTADLMRSDIRRRRTGFE